MKRASGRRRRLLILSQYYAPEIPFISADLAAAMARDMDVTVVTAHPNYPYGRFFDSVSSVRPRRSTEHGVTVWRLPLIPYHGNSIAQRALCYLSFTLAASILAPIVAGRPDIVWVYQTPFTTGIASLWFRLLYRSRVVFTCPDLWPESLLAARVATPGTLMRALFAYSRAINRAADAIVAPTLGTLARYQSDGIPPTRLHHIPVWMEGISEPTPSRDGQTELRIVYVGNIGPAQGLATLVRAAAMLQKEGVQVEFDLYGSGSAEGELRALADAENAMNVHFRGRVPPSEAFRISSRALGQIISLEPSALFRMTVPSKIAFCLAAGTPIIYGLQGEAAEILRDSGAGISFEAADPRSFVDAVKQLISCDEKQRLVLGRAARVAYERQFERSLLIERYRALFAEIVDAAESHAE
jgi:colanic acid biosynthesis glycosyl transferase WcaI